MKPLTLLLLLLLPSCIMKAPANLVPALNLDAVRNGDRNAVADALAQLQQAHNAQAATLGQRIGSWIDVPYDAANFTTDASGAWSVPLASQRRYRYLVIDNLLILQVLLRNTIIQNATTAELQIKVPAGFIVADDEWSAGAVWDSAQVPTPPVEIAGLFTFANKTYVSCQRWTTGNGLFPESAAGGTTPDFNIGFTWMGEILPPAGN